MRHDVFRPFAGQPIPLEEQFASWRELVQEPYDPERAGAFTRCRVLLLESLESQADLFLDGLYQRTDGAQLRGLIAQVRRAEEQQQLTVASLVPPAQGVLSTTICYEQLAVELSATLAAQEPDLYARETLEYALVDDFDHLYRFAQAVRAQEGREAARLTQGLTDVAPGRPTPQQHLHPQDTLRRHGRPAAAAIETHLNLASILAVEQRKYQYYKEWGGAFSDPAIRRLYAEIAEVEEQHVTQYELQPDPSRTWLRTACLWQVVEGYNYYSAWRSEPDRRLAALWERLYRMELEHIRLLAGELGRLECFDLHEVVPDEIGPLIVLRPHHEYIRGLIDDQVDLRPLHEALVPRESLPEDWPSYGYAERVQGE